MRLELSGVTKSFGGHAVLHDLSLDVTFEHTLVLVGPSGGGKSTLLRLLAGLDTPDCGEMLLDGRPVPKREEDLRDYRKHLGIVFQAYNLFPHLSALENVVLPLVCAHGKTRPEAEIEAARQLDRLQLATHSGKRPAELSGGQRQRVAIARALAIGPRALLFDEPTSALDPEMTAEVLDVIAELRGEERPLILVTHEMGFARQAADLVAFVADGSIVECTAAETFFSSPQTPAARNFLARILKY